MIAQRTNRQVLGKFVEMGNSAVSAVSREFPELDQADNDPVLVRRKKLRKVPCADAWRVKARRLVYRERTDSEDEHV
jgi:hypothetical protein